MPINWNSHVFINDKKVRNINENIRISNDYKMKPETIKQNDKF